MSKFESTLRKGFAMTFENGLTASVQWGAGNYCSNYHSDDVKFERDATSETAEVAVFRKGYMIDANQFVPEDLQSPDEVVGFLTADQVADFLIRVKGSPAHSETPRKVYRIAALDSFGEEAADFYISTKSPMTFEERVEFNRLLIDQRDMSESKNNYAEWVEGAIRAFKVLHPNNTIDIQIIPYPITGGSFTF